MHIDIHREDDRGNIIRLLKPVKIRFRGKSFVVPSGFECDGVSVPRFAWSLVSPCVDPRSIRSGVAHDYIYRIQPAEWTRSEVDLMFLCILIEDGLPISRALIAYVAVRLFGWIAWRNNRKNMENNRYGIRMD